MATSGSPSKKSEHRLPEFLVFGNLSRNFIIDLADKAHNDIPGGSALFAAAGIRCWGYPVGIVCEVGEDFPLEMLHKSYATGMDFRGVKVLPQAIDARDFYVGSNADAPLQATISDIAAGVFFASQESPPRPERRASSRHWHSYPTGLPTGYSRSPVCHELPIARANTGHAAKILYQYHHH